MNNRRLWQATLAALTLCACAAEVPGDDIVDVEATVQPVRTCATRSLANGSAYPITWPPRGDWAALNCYVALRGTASRWTCQQSDGGLPQCWYSGVGGSVSSQVSCGNQNGCDDSAWYWVSIEIYKYDAQDNQTNPMLVTPQDWWQGKFGNAGAYFRDLGHNAECHVESINGGASYRVRACETQ